mmetsp:Transcript_44752/g.124443  ORF Transcript_44752/g.124443 Transcript_44752/m.124443 type:complete len:367 (-) Transcript_44752:966-2066(-)
MVLHQALCRLCDGMRLDEHNRRVPHHHGGMAGPRDHEALLQAGVRVLVFKAVVEGPLRWPEAVRNLRILRPLLDLLTRDGPLEEELAKRVPLQPDVQPVHALEQGLHWRCACMHTVVTDVRLAVKAQGAPVPEDGPTNGIDRRCGRVGRPKHFAPEVRPGQLHGVPVDNKVVDLGPGPHELVAHRHEEAVEHIEGAFGRHSNLRAVEATGKLHQASGLLGLVPSRLELRGGEAELVAGVPRVQDAPVPQRVGPLDAKLILELLGRHGLLIGRQERSFGGDCVVLPVDQHPLVYLLCLDDTLLHDAHVQVLEDLPHKVFDCPGHCMRLDEYKGPVVVHGDVRPPSAGDVQASGDAPIHVQVLESGAQ